MNERRRALLDECFSLERWVDGVVSVPARPGSREARRQEAQAETARERIAALRREYVSALAPLAISRCPLTNEIVQLSIDSIDVDGFWWSYDTPARPLEELPSTCFAVTGALRLAAPPPWTPFLCQPGPEVPYVIPELLESAAAVVSAVTVGPHRASVVTYFASGSTTAVDAWGASDTRWVDASGLFRWDAAPSSGLDFELGPWISAGKLRWIAPRDESFTLRDTPDCPFVGLEGRRSVVRIQGGEVW